MARVTRHLRQTLVAGIIFLVPVVATFLILRLIFNSVDDLLGPTIERVLGVAIPGLGLMGVVILVYVAGLVGRNVMGRRLLAATEKALMRVPLVRTVYSPAKQLVDSFSGTGETGFKRVVMVPYPYPGSWTVGFLTGTTRDEKGDVMALVYIPTAPTPNSGLMVLLPLSEVYDTDLSVPAAIRLVLSGGIVAPAAIRKTQAQ